MNSKTFRIWKLLPQHKKRPRTFVQSQLHISPRSFRGNLSSLKSDGDCKPSSWVSMTPGTLLEGGLHSTNLLVAPRKSEDSSECGSSSPTATCGSSTPTPTLLCPEILGRAPSPTKFVEPSRPCSVLISSPTDGHLKNRAKLSLPILNDDLTDDFVLATPSQIEAERCSYRYSMTSNHRPSRGRAEALASWFVPCQDKSTAGSRVLLPFRESQAESQAFFVPVQRNFSNLRSGRIVTESHVYLKPRPVDESTMY
jgi:hypothetical protein